MLLYTSSTNVLVFLSLILRDEPECTLPEYIQKHFHGGAIFIDTFSFFKSHHDQNIYSKFACLVKYKDLHPEDFLCFENLVTALPLTGTKC